MPDDRTSAPRLSEVKPRETAGRDTIARYQAQFRAAAYECLSILAGDTIDRVYCDYQDDFMTRAQNSGHPIYHFYQVKTKSKRNHQWSKLELFGLYKKRASKAERVAASFVGKLMVHTIRFQTNCGSVIFLTNVHVDDDVEDVIASLEKGDLSNADLQEFAKRFNDAFVDGEPLNENEIADHIRKILLKPGVKYLDPHGHEFEAFAREAIFKYSEIDLKHEECEEIVQNLVDLVERKSFSKLMADMDEDDLDDLAGVGIWELLDILCISKGAYDRLQAGGDPSAVRNASIIQRKLLDGGASDEIVEYCSKCKVEWDIWLRDKRHTLPEFDLNFLLAELNQIKNRWTAGHTTFGDLEKEIDNLWAAASAKELTGTLTRELLLGGVLSALVKSEAQ